MTDEELSLAIERLTPQQTSRMQSAAEVLLECYAELSTNQSHLLAEILDDSVPRQWAHYPDDDVIDHASGYQFFYHSHSPEDRDAAGEHGHFHVFARQDMHRRDIDPGTEGDFLTHLNGEQPAQANTIHLLCVSLNAKGVPNALFTVNRWVTGDHLVSAATTLRLISNFTMQAKNGLKISKWLTALLTIFWPQIEQLLIERDKALMGLASNRLHAGLLEDESVELLSSVPIDIDQQITCLFKYVD
ncbi:MAG: hypothetical protein B7X47_03985 [Ferrovum sp. 34-44-207]|nr:MAG: hypothetical protein B7Z65_03060 [Ferrovum sp. 21-44-67]OZB33522.1 MAG: hypothetical protein B7X47_03985 [Ferrovum sp. 34-44-207]